MSTVITAEPASGWPSTSLRPFFLYDTNHPSAVAASVVAADSGSQTYVVTCTPSCAPSEFPKQTITHVSGSSWAGERTWEGATTSWGCNLGSGSDDEMEDQYGVCSATTVDSSGETDSGAGATAVNSCFVFARSVPAYITAGMDKMYKISPYYVSTMDADGYNSAFLEAQSSLHCSTTTATTTKGSKETAEAGSATGSESTLAAETATETGIGSETSTNTSTTAAPDAPSGSHQVLPNVMVVMGSVLLGTWLWL